MTSFLGVSTLMTLNDLEPQNRGFSWFLFAISGCDTHFKSNFALKFCCPAGLPLVFCVLSVGRVVLWLSNGVVGHEVLDGDMSSRPWLHSWLSAGPLSLRDSQQLQRSRAKSLCPICYWITKATDWWLVPLFINVIVYLSNQNAFISQLWLL